MEPDDWRVGPMIGRNTNPVTWPSRVVYDDEDNAPMNDDGRDSTPLRTLREVLAEQEGK